MAAVGDDIVIYIFTGEEDRDEYGYFIIPRDATHVSIHESVTVIPAELFYEHPNIVELICHAGVKRIERDAFYDCPRLKRLIIPGVEVIEQGAFHYCEAITDIECPTLERVGVNAFHYCESLRNINMPSAKDVQGSAFAECLAMTEAKFGKDLELIAGQAFLRCRSLERITIPLKNSLLTNYNIFKECGNLRHVDLVEREALDETIAALYLEEWRNDMNAEIDSINQILPNARAGDGYDEGEKAWRVRDWIERVLRKIIDYKARHRHILNVVTAVLQLTALPNDIVMNNVLSFLELPEHTFEGEGV